MKPLHLRVKSSEFDAIRENRVSLLTRYVSSKRIKYLCYSHNIRDCNEKQSKCRECFNNSLATGGYSCYPFDTAILCNGTTGKTIVKPVADVTWEDRNGDIVFVIKFK